MASVRIIFSILDIPLWSRGSRFLPRGNRRVLNFLKNLEQATAKQGNAIVQAAFFISFRQNTQHSCCVTRQKLMRGRLGKNHVLRSLLGRCKKNSSLRLSRAITDTTQQTRSERWQITSLTSEVQGGRDSQGQRVGVGDFLVPSGSVQAARSPN